MAWMVFRPVTLISVVSAPDHLQVAAIILEHHPGGVAGRFLVSDTVIVVLAESLPRGPEMHAVVMGLERSPADEAEKNDEHHFPAAESGGVAQRAAEIIHQDFEQPQSSPGDQQERPVLRQQIEELDIRPEIVDQEHAAQQDQQDRPGNRTPSHRAPPGPGARRRWGAIRTVRPNRLNNPNTISSTGHVLIETVIRKIVQREQRPQRDQRYGPANGAQQVGVIGVHGPPPAASRYSPPGARKAYRRPAESTAPANTSACSEVGSRPWY